MRYLSLDEVLFIHDEMIRRYGGRPGLRDLGLLESAIARPSASYDKTEAYPTLFGKAAAF